MADDHSASSISHVSALAAGMCRDSPAILEFSVGSFCLFAIGVGMYQGRSELVPDGSSE